MKKKKELKDRVYKLKNDKQPLSFTLNSRNTRRKPLLHFDGTHNRPLRYASNQKSPFEDEQDSNAVLEPVIFEDGMLFVAKNNPVLQEFLHYHPDNGVMFEEIDKEADAQKEVEYLEIESKAFKQASELTIDQMETLARVYLDLDTRILTTSELKRDVILFAKNNPVDFLDAINDPMLELQDTVVKIFEKGLLSLRNNGKDVYYNLKTKKTKLLMIPFGEDHIQTVAGFFQRDEGVEIYKAFQDMLKS
jgi:hypothetical protein|tara:strand:- start:20192 stop:20935 length:744 start_codon:yes stop_codon:yes gene_type:complete